MKSTTTLALLFLLSIVSYSQTDCGIDLKEAFKNRYSINSQEEIYNHFQSLFSLSETELDSLSTRYESDQSIDAEYKAFAAFWSRNKQKDQLRKKFKELKIRNEASFTIDNSFYLQYYQETTDKNALDTYVKCIQEHSETGKELTGGFSYDIIGDLLSGFTFVLKLRPANGQIMDAKIVSITQNNLEFYGSYNLKPNVLVRSFTGISQNMKLKNAGSPATLTLNIEGFDPMTVEFPAYPYANFPVGSIIASTLDFNAFSTETKNKMPYIDRLSKWAPADGRDVRNSDYGKTYNQILPDMRGQFMRGYNSFFNSKEPQQFANGNDKGGRFDKNKYSYQKDATKLPSTNFTGLTKFDGNHKHSFTDQGTAYNSEEDSGGKKGTRLENQILKNTNDDGKHQHSVSITGGGDLETTPKNIAVYYYIRINR